MQEELGQFTRNEMWDLVPRPKDANVIRTKWIFKNKTDEKGNISRNKAHLVLKDTPKWKELILMKHLPSCSSRINSIVDGPYLYVQLQTIPDGIQKRLPKWILK